MGRISFLKDVQMRIAEASVFQKVTQVGPVLIASS